MSSAPFDYEHPYWNTVIQTRKEIHRLGYSVPPGLNKRELVKWLLTRKNRISPKSGRKMKTPKSQTAIVTESESFNDSKVATPSTKQESQCLWGFYAVMIVTILLAFLAIIFGERK